MAKNSNLRGEKREGGWIFQLLHTIIHGLNFSISKFLLVSLRWKQNGSCVSDCSQIFGCKSCVILSVSRILVLTVKHYACFFEF